MNLGFTVSFFVVLSRFVLSYSCDGRVRTQGDAGRFIAVRFPQAGQRHGGAGRALTASGRSAASDAGYSP